MSSAARTGGLDGDASPLPSAAAPVPVPPDARPTVPTDPPTIPLSDLPPESEAPMSVDSAALIDDSAPISLGSSARISDDPPMSLDSSAYELVSGPTPDLEDHAKTLERPAAPAARSSGDVSAMFRLGDDGGAGAARRRPKQEPASPALEMEALELPPPPPVASGMADLSALQAPSAAAPSTGRIDLDALMTPSGDAPLGLDDKVLPPATGLFDGPAAPSAAEAAPLFVTAPPVEKGDVPSRTTPRTLAFALLGVALAVGVGFFALRSGEGGAARGSQAAATEPTGSARKAEPTPSAPEAQKAPDAPATTPSVEATITATKEPSTATPSEPSPREPPALPSRDPATTAAPKEPTTPPVKEPTTPPVKEPSSPPVKEPEPPKEPPKPVGGGEFNKGAAQGVLAAAAGAAAGCGVTDGPKGSTTLRVTFAPSGRSTQVLVSGPPFAGTPVGSCIASKFRGLSVPPFDGPAVTLTASVTIR